MNEEKEILKEQTAIIKDLIEIVTKTQKEKKDYIKSLKHICITLIITFALIIISFYILYFTSSYETTGTNVNKNINENYNFNKED